MLLVYILAIFIFLGNKSFQAYNNPDDSEVFKEFVSLDINICKRWDILKNFNVIFKFIQNKNIEQISKNLIPNTEIFSFQGHI